MSAVSPPTHTIPGLPALVFTALAGTMAMMAFVAVVGPVVRLLGLAEWHAGLAVTAAGLLLSIAALFSWFLLLGREAARLADEVDALLGAEPEPHSPTVIPFTTGRTA